MAHQNSLDFEIGLHFGQQRAVSMPKRMPTDAPKSLLCGEAATGIVDRNLGQRSSAERFSSPGRLDHDRQKTYSPPTELRLNHWGLSGSWNVNAESAVLQEVHGKVEFRFHSRDLHLVMAPSKDGKPVRFRVMLDGAAPGAICGIDSFPDGTGEVREPRLYQLVRQRGAVQDRTFEIEFLDPGVQALDFTFG
jgi:hypothetical protein